MTQLSRLLERVFDFLSSLRLAVVVMLTLGLTCLVATFYESSHGTPAAQRMFYQTWWFATVLVLLGTNIFSAMMKRYPWKRHHAGFVIAHVGILTLLGGSLVSLRMGLDSNMALAEGETGQRVALFEKALHVSLPGTAEGAFPVDFEKSAPSPGRERRFPLGNGIALVAEAYLPHARAVDEPVEGQDGPPAIHFMLKAPMATEQTWLVAGDPERSRLDFGMLSVSLETGPQPAAAPAAGAGNHLAFHLDPAGALHYTITTREGPGLKGDLVLGRAVETPWMGMKVTVDRQLAHAGFERQVVPEPPMDKEERRTPAVKLHLEGPQGRSPSEWLLWTESRMLPYGGDWARVAYRAPELALPFQVTLLRFNSDRYPGSAMAATYESFVRVDDPEQGTSEHHISMNHPMHYRGYIFFQSSFVEGRPMVSIFSVARAPGLPFVYLGVFMISAGVAWMFYLKPVLARRQAAQALAARAAAPTAASTTAEETA